MVAASSLCPSLQRQGGHLDQGREDGTRNQKICSDLYEYMNESCSVVSDCLRPHGLGSPWNSPGQDTGVRSLSLLQGIFPTQDSNSNPGLPHCKWILNQLSHKGSPRILEWIPIPFPADLPDPEIEQGLLHCRQILYQLSYQDSPKDHRGSHPSVGSNHQSFG